MWEMEPEERERESLNLRKHGEIRIPHQGPSRVGEDDEANDQLKGLGISHHKFTISSA